MESDNRYEVISDIMHGYKDMKPIDMRTQLERLVNAVKDEAVKELNNAIKIIERI